MRYWNAKLSQNKHKSHQQSVQRVCQAISRARSPSVEVYKISRDEISNEYASWADLVVAVGGDGTGEFSSIRAFVIIVAKILCVMELFIYFY